ncbi:cupin-like domain-containing protein [Marinicauda pacifica]|uniref:cupin-like domain-containing protein n=1 Tax=Marinicauda pacifica TaxID=1133559 RepID=UPI0035C7AF59
MTTPVLVDWNDEKRSEFRNGVVTSRHRLHQAPEFTDFALAELIERHPRELTDICTMGDDPTDRDSWRAGERGGLNGLELMDAVRAGRLWIQLRDAMNVDKAYKPLFTTLFDQIKRLNPGYAPLRAYGSIIISSPTAQAFYHSDVSETVFLHVRGDKRFRVYPPHAPWVSEESLEAILHKDQTEDIPFDQAWDADAAVFDLQPGDFLSWPLHAPHRVENTGGLSVSITCEVVTRESMMKNAVLHANGVLRRFGITPKSADAQGVGAYAKFALSKSWRLAVRLFGAKRPNPKSETTFDVDLAAETGFRDRATV